MTLTVDELDSKKLKAKQKLVEIQQKLIKALQNGTPCENFLQEFKVIAIWEILLSGYNIPGQPLDPNCLIAENCLTEEQILDICKKIDLL